VELKSLIICSALFFKTALLSYHCGIEIESINLDSYTNETFYRTIVELKWTIVGVEMIAKVNAFYRTIVELKYVILVGR